MTEWKRSKKLDRSYDKAEHHFLDICFFQEPRTWYYYNVAHRGEAIE